MLLVNIIHVNTIAMNKIKNIYRTLILLLSLVFMPVEGWASDGYLVASNTELKMDFSAYALNKYTVCAFYFEKDGAKLSTASWTIKGVYSSILPTSEGWQQQWRDNEYVYIRKSNSDNLYAAHFQFAVENFDPSIHNSKLVLLLSNDANLLTQKENLAGVKKMEFDLYTEDGLKSSAVKYGSNSVDFSKAESTSIIPKAATSTSVTLPDFNAKYLRWQLFESETATTPVATITDILSNSSSAVKGSDLIYFHDTKIADDAARTVSFDFSKLAANVENYVLKCTWANNEDDDAKVVTYNGSTYILQEPTLNGEYSFKFIKQETLDALPLELSADNGAAAASHDADAIYKDNKLEVSLKDVVPEILSDFGVADKKDVSDFYMRWVLADKDGKIISANSNNSALALRKTSDGVGYYTLLSKEGSSLLPNGLNVTFELPFGSSWSSDMKVYCLLTNDLTGHEAKYGVITKEPSAFKSKINVKLYSPNDLPFKHYEGIANKKGDWDIVNGHTYQKTHEWEYYYYVDGTENQIFLSLPFEYGNDLEPRGYFRWYDYNTDQESEHLIAFGDATQTKLFKKGNRGLFANNIGANPTENMIGVYYSTSHVNPSWEGETIACDVSRYVDGMDESRTYLLHEPTLSIRYIFHILPKKKIADDIMAALCNHDDGDYTYEDNKKVTFGYKDENSETTLRLQLQDISRYSFYPMTSEGLKKVVYNNDITEADFDMSKYVSVPQYGDNKVKWRIYDVSKSKYCDLSGSSRFLDLSEKKLNEATWHNLEGSAIDDKDKPVIDKGIPVFVVAYLKASDTQICPVANFDVRFMNNHPMTKAEIVAEGLNNRLISYLDEHYKMAAKPITFDDDDIEQTVAAPTNPDDNQDRLPSKWDRRAYSFVYRDLIDYDATNYGGSNKIEIGHSPLHGDYCLYKSAKLSDVSTSSQGYLWWYDEGITLYDKTYETTNGSQYGHFLYVDASNESRKIAASDFTADLCTGQQLIFIAAVADMTHQTIKPQIVFKLFGVNKDVNGEIVNKHLIHSFSSGDFKDNLDSKQPATWYQVYGKITLQKESNVEQYSDFRLEIDNYCKGTQGADYAVDDIRMYLAPAKVQVLQEKPICENATTGTIKLKIRAIHETLNAILGHKDTKIYFRFVDEDGNPVKTDYSYTLKDRTTGNTSTVHGTEYGTVDVYDSEETCKKFEIDGTNMIEQDSEGETYIVISNKDFPLTTGKKYYVSVSTEDPAKGNANWGTPAEVCSLYSNWFEMVSQHPIITDTKGNIVTVYKIPCDQADNYEVKIKGQLTTTDPNNGGKITLDNVKFFWYLDGKDEANKLNSIASNEITITKNKLPLGETHKIYMKPEGTPNGDGYIPYVINGTTYLLCTSAIPVDLRVMKDGPKLNFGFNDVDYPFNDGSYEASLRIGLPQLENLKEKNGFLKIPLHSASYKTEESNKTLTFIDDSKSTTGIASTDVYVATTNDPLWNATGATLLSTPVATLSSNTLPEIVAGTQSTLDLKFSDDVLKNFHEGYYYELRFVFEQGAASAGTTSCPGESYLKVKIVPEFITWTPTADGGMNANWNNDDNWHRSSSTELYDDKYEDYQAYGSASGIIAKVDIPTQNSYVPMKFTKVTIDNLKGLPFPDLGNIVYRSTNKIATKLTNGNGNEATKYIRYDIMAYWDESDANKGLGTDGNLKCEKFYGNTCHQIYFKPQGELRDQCYLIYDKAWVEKELEPNKWYTMASPLQYIYAGDMYVPASNGRQETKAFTDITFDTNVYSRSKYPVYQRAWMKSGVEEITPNGNYSASHYPTGAVTGNVDMNLGYWSHVYNKVDESYAADGTFGGFSIKAGNALLPKRPTDGTPLPNAILRLPKADTSYKYFDYDGSTTSGGKSVTVGKNNGHGKLLVAFNNDEKHLAEKTQSLGTDNNSGFYLVANPYTCSISMAKFFEANSGLQKAIWIVENGEAKAISSTELDKQNYAIQPTQSFFVKKNVGAAIREVRFTSTMCVDRTITPGLLMASDYVKSIEATTENSNGQTSKARIALRPEASADYDDQEDVDLLYDQNLKDIPQVYTVAGNEAVAVNAVPELSWIPLGIVSQQAEEVSLTLKGVNKLDAPVYLYDAASASFTELHEGEAVKVKAGDHGRYFLTQTRTSTGIDRMEAEEQSAPVKVYSPAAGMIVVSALGGEKLDRVQVFTMDGKMVHSYQLPDKQRMILRVPSGIYIVKASTQSCAQAKGQKIAVR